MLTQNLFDEILLRPVYEKQANLLRIVSGFASYSLARYHVEQLKKLSLPVAIELILGMTPLEGLEENYHNGFCELTKDQIDSKIKFSSWYLHDSDPVHSKIYCWLKDGIPVVGFAGSANYSVTAFLAKQRETMVKCNAKLANNYFLSHISKSILCSDNNTPEQIKIHKSEHLLYPKTKVVKPDGFSVQVPLLLKNGQSPKRSGINWGQRAGRELNQAYLALPVKIRDSDFFPPHGIPFSVIADDGWEVEMCRAQDHGKALHTPKDNSAFGRFLRGRLGLKSGEFVTPEHLEKYGRKDVTFYKVSENVYYLDFNCETVA